MAEQQSLPFVIQVLEGDLAREQLQFGQPKGTLALAGRALPYAGVDWEGTQRTKTTYYPGNPRATQQVSGRTLSNTVIHGAWKDRYLGDGASSALRTTIENIRDAGLQVKVTWGDGVVGDLVTGNAIVRVGLIKRLKWTSKIPQEGAWEIEFEWASAGEPIRAIVGLQDDSPAAALAACADLTATMGAQVEAYRLSGTVSLFGEGNALAQALDDFEAGTADALGHLQRAQERIADLANLDFNEVNSLVGIVGNVEALARGGLDTLLQMPIYAQTALDRATSVLGAFVDLFDTLEAIEQTMFGAHQLKAQLLQQVEPDVLTTVRYPAGTDLRDVAREQYGNPDLWFLIASYNGLPDSRVPMTPSGATDDPGHPIAIPRPNSPAATDMRSRC